MKKDVEKNEKRKTRFLSVIYFFDGGKTRSFKISLTVFKIALAGSALLLAWAMVGTVFLLRNLEHSHDLSEKLHASLDAIFQYQVKYNSVFENAYPAETEPNTVIKAVASKPTGPETRNHTKVEKPSSQLGLKNMLDSKRFKIDTDIPDWLVSLENPLFLKKDKNLELSIAIRNKKGQSRAEGLIWAVSEWQNAQGQVQTVNAPETKPGKAETHAATIFNIRQYKEKVFSFKIPENSVVLSKIEIWMSD